MIELLQLALVQALEPGGEVGGLAPLAPFEPLPAPRGKGHARDAAVPTVELTVSTRESPRQLL